MQITVTPDPALWVVVPEFPPPGWAREEARSRSVQLDITGPQWRTEFETLLEGLRRTERTSSLARLLHVGDGARHVFAVDVSLEPTPDDGTKEGRRSTQLALLSGLLPGTTAERLRPNRGTAGFWAATGAPSSGGPTRPSAVVVLRKAGLPIVQVDVIMQVWGAPASEIVPVINHVIDLADRVGPADAALA
ncbi:hypothetical protein [Actinomyces howellii]|uniref:Uncharacterized protein n=1 Tax=Actinomyces howellii TaxID=52771 RepID=A0A3S4R4N6_9ACTO|nr:hypothetical protein [Actinomyces howellii]VEG29621.1 Uncharacterised protein [Actinomyces howellii]